MSNIYPRKHHAHFHKVKRLNHNDRCAEKMTIANLPLNLIDKSFFNKPSQYVKYFDYPLADLLVDHSTDPLHNTTRQYVDTTSNISSEGRFKNHEMIIRRNGETTILRPKQDQVLVNGFTPVIRPSSILPSYQSMMPDSQIASSLSIMNKMSIKKPEQTSIIKAKRRNRHRKQYYHDKFNDQNHIKNHHFSNEFEQNPSTDPTFIHLVKEALHDLINERTMPPYQPAPLMSILPDFHVPSTNYYNQPFLTPIERIHIQQPTVQPSYFDEQPYIPSLLSIIPNNTYRESSNTFSPEFDHPFQFTLPQREHSCSHLSMAYHEDSTYTSGYFFD